LQSDDTIIYEYLLTFHDCFSDCSGWLALAF